MKTMHITRGAASLLCMVFVLMFGIQTYSYAVSAEEIKSGVEISLKTLRNTEGGGDVMDKAKGLLVFPGVFKAAAGAGAEYGEGALVIDGHTASYYSTAAASIGLQLGAEKKSVVIAFMTEESLRKFQESKGWKIGADASVAVIKQGTGSMISTSDGKKPIVAFVFDQKGLMFDLSLNGAKITKIQR
jgi:lipid-binding SYLF domain-containing protein